MSRPQRRHHFFYAAVDVAPVVARHPSMATHWRSRGLVRRRGCHDLEGPFRQLVAEVTADRPLRGAGIRAALDLVVVIAARHLAARDRPARSSSLMDEPPAVLRVRQAVDHAPGQQWRLDSLARLAGLSPNHLATIFKRHVGVTVHQYLTRRRLDEAQRLLRDTDLPIGRIALDLGFHSSQHFTRVFRQFNGRPPSDLRKA